MLNRTDSDAPPDLALTQSEIDLLDKLVAERKTAGNQDDLALPAQDR
jgi:hypothetical protein